MRECCLCCIAHDKDKQSDKTNKHGRERQTHHTILERSERKEEIEVSDERCKSDEVERAM